jgi:hypothetical protein
MTENQKKQEISLNSSHAKESTQERLFDHLVHYRNKFKSGALNEIIESQLKIDENSGTYREYINSDLNSKIHSAIVNSQNGLSKLTDQYIHDVAVHILACIWGIREKLQSDKITLQTIQS